MRVTSMGEFYFHALSGFEGTYWVFPFSNSLIARFHIKKENQSKVPQKSEVGYFFMSLTWCFYRFLLTSHSEGSVA